MATVECPQCHHTFNTAPQTTFKRICVDCNQPIRSHHKYYLRIVEGKTEMAHRFCNNPDSYFPKEEQ